MKTHYKRAAFAALAIIAVAGLLSLAALIECKPSPALSEADSLRLRVDSLIGVVKVQNDSLRAVRRCMELNQRSACNMEGCWSMELILDTQTQNSR